MNIKLGFILSFIAGLSTLIGSVFIFFNNKKKDNIIISSLAFASGVMSFVSFFDLIPGKEYLAKAKLVYPEDPTHVVAEAKLKFKPETKDGEIKVYFGEIDLREYAGRKLVVLEKVFDLETMLEVANHEKPTDEDQTVAIKPRKNLESKKIEKAPKTGDAGVRRLALINVLSAVLYFSAKRRGAIKNK